MIKAPTRDANKYGDFIDRSRASMKENPTASYVSIAVYCRMSKLLNISQMARAVSCGKQIIIHI
jgi:hypothetical protein